MYKNVTAEVVHQSFVGVFLYRVCSENKNHIPLSTKDTGSHKFFLSLNPESLRVQSGPKILMLKWKTIIYLFLERLFKIQTALWPLCRKSNHYNCLQGVNQTNLNLISNFDQKRAKYKTCMFS